jgi:negative regulator of flagellin synthesis FlgM
VKIDKTSNPLPPGPPGEGRTAPPLRSDSTPTPQRAESTSVSLGSTASQLRIMEEGMSGEPTINAAKVAEIKQAISEGRFKVNSEAIADGLIATVRELIGEQA